MLTETEALARAIAIPMYEHGAFGKAQAEDACSSATAMFKDGDVDPATFGRVIARIGNHSAMRQWGVKMGFIKANDADRDALAKACDDFIAKHKAAIESAIDGNGGEKPKP